MTMAEDYTTLNNPKFLYLAEMHHPFPDWVASAPVPTGAEFEKKAASAFADVERRLLPISTKSATFHSAINVFAKLEDFSDEVFGRVKQACAFYDIEKDVEPYVGLFVDEVEKSASLVEIPEGRYAINTTAGGEDFKLLPLNDQQDVISSAFELAKMASDNRIHLLMLVPAAREVIKAATDHGVDIGLPSIVSRFGEVRVADSEVATKLIEGREEFCKDASIKEIVAKDYQDAISLIAEDPEEAMVKIATIDHAAGIVPNYRIDARVPTPFDIVFTGPLDSEVEKAARENVIVRGVLVPIDAARSIDLTEAEFKLSKEASASLSKLRDVTDARDLSLAIENWAKDDQKTFLRLAVSSVA